MIESSIRRTPRPLDVIGLSTQALRDTFQIAAAISRTTSSGRIMCGVSPSAATSRCR